MTYLTNNKNQRCHTRKYNNGGVDQWFVTSVMSFFTKLLARNASLVRFSVLRKSPLYITPVHCLYSFPKSCLSSPKSAVHASLTCGYSTGPGHKRPTKKNYYRVLGVSPKATQAQIKNAFYKLSLKHHPDKHKGSEESHDKFQEISEAYNVLGNHEERKVYDRDLVVDGQLRAEQAYTSASPSKPRQSIYNFDEWTKAHYSKQLNKNQQSKWQKVEDREELNKPKMKIGSYRMIIFAATAVVFSISYFIHLQRIEEEAKKHGF